MWFAWMRPFWTNLSSAVWWDDELLNRLPPTVDPCGENGEYHTFVCNGPMFREPVPVRRGEVVFRAGFWFCDLVVDC